MVLAKLPAPQNSNPALVNRFFDWAIIILVCLTGALLVTRGLELLAGEFSGAIGTLIWIVLAVLGFVNLSRR